MLDWGVYNFPFHLGLSSHKPKLKNIDSSFLKSVLDKVKPQTGIYDVEEHFVVMLQFSEGLKHYWECAAHNNVEQPNETLI
jgi:hypothetical protein